MTGGASPGNEVVLETGRLLLRPWRVAEAVVQRELWAERDPRVPPHRRIDGDGRPTVADLEDSIRANQPSSIGLLAVERKAARDVIGYCGLIDSGRGSEGEPELAFELLRRVWRQGYATEAALAVLDWARSSGYERLWARSGSGTPLLAVSWPRSDSPRPSGRSWTRSTGPPCSPRDGSDPMFCLEGGSEQRRQASAVPLRVRAALYRKRIEHRTWLRAAEVPGDHAGRSPARAVWV